MEAPGNSVSRAGSLTSPLLGRPSETPSSSSSSLLRGNWENSPTTPLLPSPTALVDYRTEALATFSGFLAFLSLALTTGSYLVPWSETFVQFRSGYQEDEESKNFWKTIENETRYTIFEGNFRNTVKLFRESGSHCLVTATTLGSVVLPAIWMGVVQPFLFWHGCFSGLGKEEVGEAHRPGEERLWRRVCCSICSPGVKELASLLTAFEILGKYALSVSFSWAVLWVAITVNLSLASHDDNGDDGFVDGNRQSGAVDLEILNLIRGGSVAYVSGVMFGLWFLAVVRSRLLSWLSQERRRGATANLVEDPSFSAVPVEQPGEEEGVAFQDQHVDDVPHRPNRRRRRSRWGRSPPPKAAFTWHKGIGAAAGTTSLEEGNVTSLGAALSYLNAHSGDLSSSDLETMDIGRNDSEQEPQVDGGLYRSSSLNLDIYDDESTASSVTGATSLDHHLDTCHRCCRFDEGICTSVCDCLKQAPWGDIASLNLSLASTLLLIPFYALPVLQMTYSGLGSSFLNETVVELKLWDFPRLLWSNGKNGGTDWWILLACTSAFYVTVVIVPLICLLAILAMRLALCTGLKKKILCGMGMTDTIQVRWGRRAYKTLSFLHPQAANTVFAITLLMSSASLKKVSRYLFNKHNICSRWSNIMGEGECLTVEGTVLGGCWFSFCQGFALDILIYWTLLEYEKWII